MTTRGAFYRYAQPDEMQVRVMFNWRAGLCSTYVAVIGSRQSGPLLLTRFPLRTIQTGYILARTIESGEPRESM